MTTEPGSCPSQGDHIVALDRRFSELRSELGSLAAQLDTEQRRERTDRVSFGLARERIDERRLALEERVAELELQITAVVEESRSVLKPTLRDDVVIPPPPPPSAPAPSAPATAATGPVHASYSEARQAAARQPAAPQATAAAPEPLEPAAPPPPRRSDLAGVFDSTLRLSEAARLSGRCVDELRALIVAGHLRAQRRMGIDGEAYVVIERLDLDRAMQVAPRMHVPAPRRKLIRGPVVLAVLAAITIPVAGWFAFRSQTVRDLFQAPTEQSVQEPRGQGAVPGAMAGALQRRPPPLRLIIFQILVVAGRAAG